MDGHAPGSTGSAEPPAVTPTLYGDYRAALAQRRAKNRATPTGCGDYGAALGERMAVSWSLLPCMVLRVWRIHNRARGR